MKKLSLIGLLSLLSFGCVAHRNELKCRFTALDGQHKPVKPHGKWDYGHDACMVKLTVLSVVGSGPTENFGVEAQGPKKLRLELFNEFFGKQVGPAQPQSKKI